MAAMASFLFSIRLSLAFLCLCLVNPAASAEATWTEVRSPHFRVLTDGSVSQGREVAKEFEQMRYVFVLLLEKAEIESGAPLTIVAAKDEATFKKLEPQTWKTSGGRIAGEFHRGWEKQFAIIRLDTWGDFNQVVAYHEYTHSVLHANAHWLPTWLDEGMAEFYAYTRFQGDKIYIGAPSRRQRELKTHHLIPVATMLDVNGRSPYYRDEDKVQVFYAESWAMVHYMIFGPNMGNGSKLTAFYRLLQDRTPQDKAFQQIFGDLKPFEEGLDKYLSRFTFSAGILPPDPGLDPKSFETHKLSEAETDYQLGCYLIGSRNREEGRTLIVKSLDLDPKLAGAHEELGFLNFDMGTDADAVAEWKKAVLLDPTLTRSQFALIMSDPLLREQSAEQLKATRARLQHVTELGPKFAPPYVELALLEWRAGLLQAAYKDAHSAETLEPWRAGYHLLTAQILLHGNQPALAATASRYVAGHWTGADHNEAVDLWKEVPEKLRGDGPPLTWDFPADSQVIRGTINEVTCSHIPGAGSVVVSIIPDGAAKATPLKFSSNGRFTTGFSDTLWWGEDHFSVCHHLEGHKALAAYKPQGADCGQLISLEVRDDLPTPAPAAVQTAAH